MNLNFKLFFVGLAIVFSAYAWGIETLSAANENFKSPKDCKLLVVRPTELYPWIESLQGLPDKPENVYYIQKRDLYLLTFAGDAPLLVNTRREWAPSILKFEEVPYKVPDDHETAVGLNMIELYEDTSRPFYYSHGLVSHDETLFLIARYSLTERGHLFIDVFSLETRKWLGSIPAKRSPWKMYLSQDNKTLSYTDIRGQILETIQINF